MTRLLVHVEGQTEETFVNEILAPHLYQFGYSHVNARLLGNSRQRSNRGGIKAWHAVRSDILRHLKSDQESFSTLMVDYYALPHSGPNLWPMRSQSVNLDFANKASVIQQALHEEICAEMGSNFQDGRFIPYIMMYEFEGLLFSNPNGLAKGIGFDHLSPNFQDIRENFDSPEHINDSPQTAPSKRILNLVPEYNKPLQGVLAILEIGLDVIREECPLFDCWVQQLERGCNNP